MQRFARHANPITTAAYTHSSDEELYARIGGIQRSALVRRLEFLAVRASLSGRR